MVRCRHSLLASCWAESHVPDDKRLVRPVSDCKKKEMLHNPEGRYGVPPALHVCNSTTSPSVSRWSRPTCCPSNPDLPHTRAYFNERARSLCTSRATSSTVCPRRSVKGRSRSGGRPGTFVCSENIRSSTIAVFLAGHQSGHLQAA
jgi:hypothetical protein